MDGNYVYAKGKFLRMQNATFVISHRKREIGPQKVHHFKQGQTYRKMSEMQE